MNVLFPSYLIVKKVRFSRFLTIVFFTIIYKANNNKIVRLTSVNIQGLDNMRNVIQKWKSEKHNFHSIYHHFDLKRNIFLQNKTNKMRRNFWFKARLKWCQKDIKNLPIDECLEIKLFYLRLWDESFRILLS